MQIEIPAGFHERGPDLLAFLVWTPHLQPGGAGHPVIQGADRPSGDVDRPDPEKPDLRKRAAVHLFEHLQRIWSLNLETVQRANDGFSSWVRGRAVILDGLDVVSTRRGMELDPAGRR